MQPRHTKPLLDRRRLSIGQGRRIADLFCGAGGAAYGYWLLGFEVVGVDIKRQRNYPFQFHQQNALDFNLANFDAVHASPPCQGHTTLKYLHKHKKYISWIKATRSKVIAAEIPYVIENVPHAPLKNPFKLCGTMFNLGTAGFQLHRHRLFETNFAVPPRYCDHRRPAIGVYGNGPTEKPRQDFAGGRPHQGTLQQKRDAMGIGWMTNEEINEAIPPAYTRFIGRHIPWT